MPGSRVSLTGGTLAGTNSAIGSLPCGKMRFQQGQVICVVPIDDFTAGSLPDALMRQDIFQCLTNRTQPVRLTDPVRMQCDTHHAALLGTLGINRVEVIQDL